MSKKIGVLALQGDFDAHQRMLNKLNIVNVAVRKADQLDDLNGLIIPGGESTALIKLLLAFNLVEPIREFYKMGKGLFGTCAGSILLAREIENSDQFRFGFIDITVARNGYGRQVDSFEDEIQVKEFGKPPIHAIFIRAPKITGCGKNVSVLAEKENSILIAKEKNVMVSTFHPELTEDTRLHNYFIDTCI
ncbi:pyridoxal 5'-phosphate synthase glutaminase subunit PdxT [bacterium]|nr:MAG: pyridoxal 5'-phosphate synthase glutaminase subunit PdxT [bacterium]